MEKRKLGKSGLEVSAIGMGCMGLSHAYGEPVDRKQAEAVIGRAIEQGCDFFDTAEVYGTPGNPHHNEELLGEVLAPYRDKVVIATKFGISFDMSNEGGPHPLIPDSRPETIHRAVEGSLRRLHTDHIDLYYQHRMDPNVAPELVAETMAELAREGKILHWGISEVDADYLRRANKVFPVAAVQERHSMMARWNEAIIPVLEELGIGFVAFSPLANGLLTCSYGKDVEFDAKTDYRAAMPQFQRDGIDKNQQLLDLLHNIAEAKNATPAQLSLAWMLSKKPYIVPIPGTRKVSRLEENLGAANIKLSKDEVARIDELLNQTPMSTVFDGSRVESKKHTA